MSWDIYGEPLRKGHCEVHPWVHEEYPCSVCYSESDKEKREKEQQRQLSIEREREMQRQMEVEYELMRSVINMIVENNNQIDDETAEKLKAVHKMVNRIME